ncbi:hypothetical protein [Caulobacter sp. Root487D2Y]|uniref:hypothetical protein n=1 Tax=Caulobacter sp. Root487D2Y TaxID=1736547 RepID=UPI000A8106F2|nr:hypothetical protein [Caulobacter sp. Root487D2Y]
MLLIGAHASAPDQPRTYLASIVGIPLKPDESVESFSIETWGVTFGAVCRIPSGWRIKAGNSATPDGILEGEGSQGATWFSRGSPKALDRFVLITLYEPVQKDAVGSDDAKIPATFSGYATISTVDDGEVKVPLDWRNVRLIRASGCTGNAR